MGNSTMGCGLSSQCWKILLATILASIATISSNRTSKLHHNNASILYDNSDRCKHVDSHHTHILPLFQYKIQATYHLADIDLRNTSVVIVRTTSQQKTFNIVMWLQMLDVYKLPKQCNSHGEITKNMHMAWMS